MTVVAWILGIFFSVAIGAAVLQGLPWLVGKIVGGFASIFWPAERKITADRSRRSR